MVKHFWKLFFAFFIALNQNFADFDAGRQGADGFEHGVTGSNDRNCTSFLLLSRYSGPFATWGGYFDL